MEELIQMLKNRNGCRLADVPATISSTVEERRPETGAFGVFLFKEATGNSFGQTVFQEWKVELKDEGTRGRRVPI